jgi:hypothetical protein
LLANSGSKQKNRLIQSVLRTIFAIFLIGIFILPYGTIDAGTKDLKNVYSSYEWVLSIFIILSFSWLLSLALRKEITIPGKVQKILNPVCMIVATLILSHFLGYYCFNFRPHLIDSIVQLWQAKTFSQGQLYSSYKEPISFFVSQHMLFDAGKMYSQYPPGNPLFLTLNYFTAFPNLSGFLFCFLTLFSTYRFCKREYSRDVARINLLLFFCSGFFLFNCQSYMNHVPGLAFAALCLDMYSLWKKNGQSKNLFFTGMSLGALFICRPLEGAFLAVVFGLGTVWTLAGRPRIASAVQFAKRIGVPQGTTALTGALAAAGGFLSIGFIYFLFNYFTTGDVFLAGYIKLWGRGHDLGFHESPWGDQHTLLKGLEGFYINLKLLNEYLFESPIPPLSILGIYLLQRKVRLNSWDIFLAFLSFSIPFIYVFYWHRDSFLGPRYAYISLAFLLPLLANAIYSLVNLCKGVTFPANGKQIRAVYVRNVLLLSFAFSFLYIVTIGLPVRAKVYATSFFSMKKSLKEDLNAQGIEKALVFIKVSFGTRIIASLRELQVSASLTEKAYRTIDHCLLGEEIKKYRSLGYKGPQIEKNLEDLMAEKQILTKIALNGDPSLRLRSPDKIPPACQEEINYDLKGYTIYEPHLLENNINFTPPLVVARDMREENSVLAKLYPEIREYYLWAPGDLEKINF